MAISSSLVISRDSGAPENDAHEATTREEADKISPVLKDDGVLSMIASYYGVCDTTMQRFTCLTKTTKLNVLLEILTSAVEFEQLPVRPGEEELIRSLLMNNERFSFDNPNCTNPHVKANALLQAHFSRQPLSGDLAADQAEVLLTATRLLPAMVDVILCVRWSCLAYRAMKVSQMVTQGMWECDSILLQLPYFTRELAKRCEDNLGGSVMPVYDMMYMVNERRELLGISDAQLSEIAKVCNRIPDIDCYYRLDSEDIRAGEVISLEVILQRNLEGSTEGEPVYAPRYPKAKEEGWWLTVSERNSNRSLAVRRVCIKRRMKKVKLEFDAPAQTGMKDYALELTCDSYMGCDQVHYFSVDVKDTGAPEDEDMRE
ncbi:U5 small nuclear ribonucleoprotein 200 kDa helicase-like protein [Heracleum sosnowskyi]|uniref:U5 small nuclear ribonucleoprotein 200 kDa helicase-like protein n=1 Tax=Heracleum sosnowskyi TaxID=360622 RepID=A0AAD8I154_9APIA|nr:U5 small nuclear ribonucleoprotein 200 kDa helicase-like protein [Heracleum sosnowskyi]